MLPPNHLVRCILCIYCAWYAKNTFWAEVTSKSEKIKSVASQLHLYILYEGIIQSVTQKKILKTEIYYYLFKNQFESLFVPHHRLGKIETGFFFLVMLLHWQQLPLPYSYHHAV